MLSFREFLYEEENFKLKHLEHLEDHPINDGPEGFHHAIGALHTAHNVIKSGKASHQLTTKYDGSPSIVYGHHPETGKFFVGTKSALAKNPKINHTPEDIDRNHEAPGLREKLKHALTHLPKIAPKSGVYQGDMMFSGGDVKHEGGAVHFKPNTISYSKHADSEEGKKIASAKMGLVTHTQYHGKTLADMHATFNPDTHNFKQHGDVYHVHASYDPSKTKLSPEEHATFIKHITAATKIHEKHGAGLYEPLAKNREHVKTYINKTVATGEKPNVEGLKSHISGKITKTAEGLKTEKGKVAKMAERDSHMAHIDNNREQYHNVFKLHNHLQKAKNTLVGAMDRHTTFDHHINGKATAPEGYVAHFGSGPTKLVNRHEFSKANFEFSANRKKEAT